MKKSEKIVIGVAVGAVVALFLMPKSRKMLSEALCNLTGSLKNMMNKAEDIAANTK
jgi:gas vesicle protein